MSRLLTWIRRTLAGAAFLVPTLVLAQSSNLLIQLQPGGSYRVWYADGPSVLSDDEVLLLDSLAEPKGGEIVETSLGAARARQSDQGVVIELLDRAEDKALLVDRDGCGHLKTWHADGATPITEDQITDLVISAIPGGGPRLVLDADRHAKAFLTNLGVMVAVWRPPKRAK
jgi:hypothetical protein